MDYNLLTDMSVAESWPDLGVLSAKHNLLKHVSLTLPSIHILALPHNGLESLALTVTGDNFGLLDLSSNELGCFNLSQSKVIGTFQLDVSMNRLDASCNLGISLSLSLS